PLPLISDVADFYLRSALRAQARQRRRHLRPLRNKSPHRSSRRHGPVIAKPTTCAIITIRRGFDSKGAAMMLTRKTDGSSDSASPRLTLRRLSLAKVATMDRRAFLKRSGLAAGVGAFASQLPYGTMTKAEAADDKANVAREVHRTVCTHCSV